MSEHVIAYSGAFYENMKKGNTEIANLIMPYIVEKLSPLSVLDAGCGQGIFLRACLAVDENIKVLGIDGDYVERDKLLINPKYFMAYNLENPLKLNEKYDIAISFEVAEHIEEKYADIFIDTLTNASDTIFFSAAIPYQGGTNHVNEQWQSYWKEKFEARGYIVSDCLKRKFWNQGGHMSYRINNLLVCCKSRKTIFMLENDNDKLEIVNTVHPHSWLQRIDEKNNKIYALEKDNETLRWLLGRMADGDVKAIKEYLAGMPIWKVIDKYMDIFEYIYRVDREHIFLPGYLKNIYSTIILGGGMTESVLLNIWKH